MRHKRQIGAESGAESRHPMSSVLAVLKYVVFFSSSSGLEFARSSDAYNSFSLTDYGQNVKTCVPWRYVRDFFTHGLSSGACDEC